jgi:ATP-dependent Clp protease ATP-binding subunit ClpC
MSKYEQAIHEGRDLTGDLAKGPVLHREREIVRVLESLERRRSVLLVGPPGVGKSAVARGVAERLSRAESGKLLQFNVSQLLAGTYYVGEWQTKLESILGDALRQKAVLYFTDIWNLVGAGRSSSSNETAWDSIRPRIEAGNVTLLGEVTADQRVALQAEPGFESLFDVVDIAQLTAEQSRDVVAAAADRLGLTLDAATTDSMLQLCERFMPASAGPRPPLALLEQIAHYRAEKRDVDDDEPLTPAFVEKVFAMYSGLPRFIVSREETRSVGEIRGWFRERVVGQTDAIEAVVQTLALFKAGLHDPRRPIGSFLFVGPTGVGKTELARALATYLFGSEKRLLRFDLSEFKDYHSFESLIGDPDNPAVPARLVDPIRAQPFQVVLFDELEKAHSNVWDLLLQLLDDGRLTPARGATIDFRNTIVVATSNVGALAGNARAIGFAASDAEAGADAAAFVAELESFFRPEFLNRFQHIVRFRALSSAQLRTIARGELARVIEREGIVGRKLVVDVGDEVLDYVVARSYDPRYGARALRRYLQQLIVMPIATRLLESRLYEGSILRLTVRNDEVRLTVVETDESAARRAEVEPAKMRDGRRLDREGLLAAHRAAAERLDRLRQSIGLAALAAHVANLEERRRSPEFWKNPASAAALLDEYDRTRRSVERIERLGRRERELEELLQRPAGTPAQEIAERLARFELAVAAAYREMVVLGPGGYPNALVDIRPVGRSRAIRDLLVDTYRAWATLRRYRVVTIAEPVVDSEPAILGFVGPYAFGYLQHETGHHRLTAGADSFVARVRVIAWTSGTGPAPIATQKALKQTGQLGGRIRSRLEFTGSDLLIQNDRSLTENRELADDIAAMWSAAAPVEPDVVVRRYDTEPFRVRDVGTGTTTGRSDVLRPEGFHALLCRRLDAL